MAIYDQSRMIETRMFLISDHDANSRRPVVQISWQFLATIAAEYTFTLYFQVNEFPIIVEHLLKLFSYWLLFVAIALAMFVGPSQAHRKISWI